MFENKDKNSPATVGDLEELAAMVVNNFVTKEDLKQELDSRNFATKDDLRQELKNYATKEDFNGLSRELRGEMTTMKGEFTEMKNEILNSNDKLIKKLDTYQIENAMFSGHTKENTDEVDKLKIRVTTIEKHIGIEPVAVIH